MSLVSVSRRQIHINVIHYACVEQSAMKLISNLKITVMYTLWHNIICIFSQFLMPGLVDTHIHAPQYVNSGTGYDHMLLDWLKKYTYPTEAKFKDVQFAKQVYTKAVVSVH